MEHSLRAVVLCGRLVKVWDSSILVAPPATPATFDPSDTVHLSQLQPNEQKSMPSATVFVPAESSESEEGGGSATFQPSSTSASGTPLKLRSRLIVRLSLGFVRFCHCVT
jgi:hypothetical protein